MNLTAGSLIPLLLIATLAFGDTIEPSGAGPGRTSKSKVLPSSPGIRPGAFFVLAATGSCHRTTSMYQMTNMTSAKTATPAQY